MSGEIRHYNSFTLSMFTSSNPLWQKSAKARIPKNGSVCVIHDHFEEGLRQADLQPKLGLMRVNIIPSLSAQQNTHKRRSGHWRALLSANSARLPYLPASAAPDSPRRTSESRPPCSPPATALPSS